MLRRILVRLPIALVIAAVLVAQVGAARAALCPTGGERAAPCRCCAKADRPIEHDATVRARCCAIGSEGRVVRGAEPAARRAEPPPIAAVPVLAIAVAPVVQVAAPPFAPVVARASGPPLWLRTLVIRS